MSQFVPLILGHQKRSQTLKIFNDPLETAELSLLASAPIEVADEAVTAILRLAEASQRNIFATLAVTLHVANERKIYARHVDQYGEPFKSMDSWIKSMYPETWRYAKDAFAAAVAMPEVPIEYIAKAKRCNAVRLAESGISPMVRRDIETLEMMETATEKEFIEHINSKHGQHLEGPRTLKITGPESGIKKIESALDEIGETWNISDRFGQLEALVEDWRQGGHSEATA